jgi:preprotein translocase SecE subunit
VANKMSEKKKSASQSETEEPKTRTSEKELKGAKASAREERQSKPVRRETKAATTSASTKKRGGFRNWRIVRFARESYHELRYKVTWPTFPEARNMTLVVIALSTVIGLVLGLVDAGLFQLFKLVTGK